MRSYSIYTGTVLLVSFWLGFRCAQSTTASYLPMHTEPTHTLNNSTTYADTRENLPSSLG